MFYSLLLISSKGNKAQREITTVKTNFINTAKIQKVLDIVA